MYKSYSMELAGRTLTVDIGRVAKQANGAALMHYGDTTVLSTATASKEPREGIDFFPLSVEYEEKMYAVGKIPGGFNKREGKASEHAILTSRVIDRPMRPLFPKDYRNDVTLVNMVMSVDPECNPEIPAMLGSSIATCISDIPFDGPCATTQVGLINGEFIINPSLAQKELSDLQLTVASTREKVIMIEAGANEVPEDVMIEAIYKAHDVNQEIIRFIDKIVAECGKEKHLTLPVQFRKNFLRQSKRSSHLKKWKRLFSQMTNRQEKKILERSQQDFRRHLQTMKNGWQFLEKPYISTRKRLFVR